MSSLSVAVLGLALCVVGAETSIVQVASDLVAVSGIGAWRQTLVSSAVGGSALTSHLAVAAIWESAIGISRDARRLASAFEAKT